MTKLSKETLLSLRDYIGDALSDPDVTPQEIAQAILDELNDLVEYHSAAHSKAKETLSLFSKTDDISDAWEYFVKDDAIETAQDLLTYGEYGFALNSDYLDQAAQPVDWNDSKDIVDFGDYIGNKKNKKNRKNKDK